MAITQVRACVTSSITYETHVSTSYARAKQIPNNILHATTIFQPLRQPEKKHATTLSASIWKFKDENVSYNIKWKILSQTKPYIIMSKRCSPCLLARLYLLKLRTAID